MKTLGLLLGLLGAVAAVSSLIALPLWYVATSSRRAYTIIGVGGICGTVLSVAVLRVVRGLRSGGTAYLLRLAGSVARVVIFLGFAAAAYGILRLFSLRLYAAAAGALFVFLLLLGVYRYGRKPA